MTIQAVLVVGTIATEVRHHLDSLAAAGITVRTVRRHGVRAVTGGLDAFWRHASIRAADVLVIDACAACPVPAGSTRIHDGEARPALAALRRRVARGELPGIPGDPAWTVEVLGADPAAERVYDSWLAMVDGVIGTLGSPLCGYAPARREVLVAGVFAGSGPDSDLLRAPDWTRLAGDLKPDERIRRVLDLRTGLLHHDARSTVGPFRGLTFASRAIPGVGVMRVEGAGARARRGAILSAELGPGDVTSGEGRPSAAAAPEARLAVGTPGGVAVAVSQVTVGGRGRRRLDRLAAYVPRRDRPPRVEDARQRLGRAERLGFDRLVSEQRRVWARRWNEMGIRLDGDPELQHAVNFSLFHLDASIARALEAPLGPRGLSGPSYRGHVFWDSEVFVLPFFAATRPAAARAMLAYRVARLAAARAAAREAGLQGAWFPWESAADGRDVTPPWVPGPAGQPIRVWTGERELHVVADIAWAARHYLDWTGDERFAAGGARRILVETARFWTSRFERDSDGSAHVRGIIGPDEYHELVDDNAFTNVMARWNLRAATALVKARPSAHPGQASGDDEPTAEEVASWLELAGHIVDGYDPGTRIYEQFSGFHALEPIRVAELFPRPASADALLGRERVERAQVVKQTDVLLLHHLVPGEVVDGSLEANLDYYEPRTAHGSSLSAGTHAALLARARRFDGALEALRMAALFDLDDRNGTASEGLHIQTMGSVWQALVMGFGGIRPRGDALAVDPRLAPGWSLLEVPVRFRGRQVRVTIRPGALHIQSSAPLPIVVPGLGQRTIAASGIDLVERDGGWSPPA